MGCRVGKGKKKYVYDKTKLGGMISVSGLYTHFCQFRCDLKQISLFNNCLHLLYGT
jgi:hypothetical protein